MKRIFRSILVLSFSFAILAYGSFSIVGKTKGISKGPTVYALSIGIDKHKPDSGLIGLRGPKRDAGLVGESISVAYQAIGQKRTSLFDEDATREGILNALDTFAQSSTSDDIVLFTYSGHGSYLKAETRSGIEGSLVPYDSDLNGTRDIRASELLGKFRKIRAKTKIVLIDGCHFVSENAASAFSEDDPVIAALIKENYLIIGVDETSFTYEGMFPHPETGEIDRFGLLSYYFANGLRGRADTNGSKTIDSKELEIYMTHEIKKSGKPSRLRVLSSGLFDTYSGERIETQEKSAVKKGSGATLKRAQLYMSDKPDKNASRNGDDYALLFANDKYDEGKWATLKNPKNDVRDIAKELKEKYGFKGVEIKENQTTQEIYDTIASYQGKKFEKHDDQLFIFFAGHGVTDDVSSGFYVGRDSPYPFTRKNSGEFVQLDRLLTAIDLIPVHYSMTVFDACFAGQIWKAAIQLVSETAMLSDTEAFYEQATLSRQFPRSIGKMSDGSMFLADLMYQDVSRSVYAKRKMKNKSRVIMTSGDRPVDDAFEEEDGSLSRNSPFADAFLRALRTGGGEDGVLITAEIIPFIDKLNVEPQKGRLSGSDGDFVFVRPERQIDSNNSR